MAHTVRETAKGIIVNLFVSYHIFHFVNAFKQEKYYIHIVLVHVLKY